MDSDTQRFIACIRDHDRGALDALLDEHRQSCLSRAWRIVGNAADAEDVVQDAFLRLVRTVDAYDGSVPFGAWLGQLVQSASLNARTASVRRRHREERAAAAPESPTGDADDEARLALLRRMVEELPPELRTPIELRFFAGMSQKEAAERLGVSENAVALRVRRGKERLRRRLGDAGVVIAWADLDGRLAEAAGREAPLAAGAAAGGSMKAVGALGFWLVIFMAIAIAIAIAVGTWPWRFAQPASRVPSFEPAAAQGQAPATAAGPRRVYAWNFDDGPPPVSELLVIAGGWRHAPGDGRGGSGCMETDDGLTNIVIPGATLTGAAKLSMLNCPLGAASEPHGVGVGWVDAGDHTTGYNYWLRNVGVPFPFDFTADAKRRALFRTVEYLGDDSEDSWNERGRDTLSFNHRAGILCLSIQGRWRIDDLRLEEIDPRELPDISAYRRAVYAVPRELRRGATDLPGLKGADPGRPVSVEWSYTTPDAPLLAR